MPDQAWLYGRVLVRRGKRDGQRGMVDTVRDDGTLQVLFVIPVGGGVESQHYLPDDLELLGPESSFAPMLNCHGDDPLRRFRMVATG